MDKDVDLSIRLAGLTFKSPIVVSSSECAANLSLIENLVDKNIGAIELRNRRDKKRVIWNNQGLAVPFIAHHD
jgi:dihydroorotate dehydrogenase